MARADAAAKRKHGPIAGRVFGCGIGADVVHGGRGLHQAAVVKYARGNQPALWANMGTAPRKSTQSSTETASCTWKKGLTQRRRAAERQFLGAQRQSEPGRAFGAARDHLSLCASASVCAGSAN